MGALCSTAEIEKFKNDAKKALQDAKQALNESLNEAKQAMNESQQGTNNAAAATPAPKSSAPDTGQPMDSNSQPSAVVQSSQEGTDELDLKTSGGSQEEKETEIASPAMQTPDVWQFSKERPCKTLLQTIEARAPRAKASKCEGKGGYVLEIAEGALLVPGKEYRVDWTRVAQHRDVTDDYIAIYPPGSSNYIRWDYTKAGVRGACSIKTPKKPGMYEIRYFVYKDSSFPCTLSVRVGNDADFAREQKRVALLADALLDIGEAAQTGAKLGTPLVVKYTKAKPAGDKSSKYGPWDVIGLWTVGAKVDDYPLVKEYAEGDLGVQKSVKLVPEQAGTFELRFVQNGDKTVASRMLQVHAKGFTAAADSKSVASTEPDFPIKRPPSIWATIRVFISSTFVDTHGERDVLVRKVFPRLNKHFLNQRIRVVPVDLRWGVTADEASRIQQTCLNELDRCRSGPNKLPWFIGLRGERYGWVQPKYDPSSVFLKPEFYGWLDELEKAGTRVSITSLEVYHAFLRCQPPSSERIFNRHAFIYFRDPSFKKNCPENLQWIFDFDYRDPTYAPKDATLALQYGLTPQWQQYQQDLDAINAEMKADTKLCSSFQYPCEFGEVNVTGQAPNGKRFGTGSVAGLAAFEQRVFADLSEAIAAEYAPVVESSSPQDLESLEHQLFADSKSRVFVGRAETLSKLSEYCDGKAAANAPITPLVLFAGPGSGKSALMAKFTSSYLAAHRADKMVVVAHMVGATSDSIFLNRLLYRLCYALSSAQGITEALPETTTELSNLFRKLLNQVGALMRVVIIIDAVNQLSPIDYAHHMTWLPSRLPDNVRVVVSTLEHECLTRLRAFNPPAQFVELTALALEERKDMVRGIMRLYHKQLSEDPSDKFLGDQLGAVMDKGQSDNPLYLSVVCEALREFGVYEKVTAYIRETVPGTLQGVFEHYLDILEQVHGRHLIATTLSLLNLAQGGLLESEILDLLDMAEKEDKVQATSNFATCYQSLALFLAASGATGVLQLFHQQLAFVVRKRYLTERAHVLRLHALMGRYFVLMVTTVGHTYERAMRLAPYHLIEARLLQDAGRLLFDFDYLEAMCRLKYHVDLLRHYKHLSVACNDALEGKGVGTQELSAAELQAVASTLRVVTQFQRFFTQNMHAFVANPLLIVPTASNSVIAAAARATQGNCAVPYLQSTWIPTVQDPCVFSIPFGEREVTCLDISPHGGYFVLGEAAFGTISLWDLETGAVVQTTRTSKVESDRVGAVAFSPDPVDPFKLAFALKSKGVGIADVNAGVVLQQADGRCEEVCKLAFSLDGTKLLFASNTNFGLLDLKTGSVQDGWELDNGGHGTNWSRVYDLRLIDQGNVCVMTSPGPLFQAFVAAKLGGFKKGSPAAMDWEETLRPYGRIDGGGARSVDGKHFAITCKDYETHIIVVYTVEGVKIREMYGHDAEVTCLDFDRSKGGQSNLLVSCSKDRTVILWDWTTGQLLQQLLAHTDGIKEVRVAGSSLVTYSDDRTIRIFDVTWALQNMSAANTSWVMRTGQELELNASHLNSNGRYLITYTIRDYECSLLAFDVTTGKIVRSLKVKTRPTEGNTFIASPNFDRLFYIDDYKLMMVDLKTWLAKPSSSGIVREQNRTEGNHYPGDTVWQASWSADGKRILSCCARCTVVLWKVDGLSVSQLAVFKNVHKDQPKACALSDDGRWGASASRDMKLLVWDFDKGKVVAEATLPGDYSPKLMLVRGDIIIVGTEGREGTDNVLCYTKAGAVVRSLIGLKDMPNAMCFSPDGTLVLAAAGWSGGACLWRAHTGEVLARLPILKDLVGCAFSTDGRSLALVNPKTALGLAVGALVRQFEAARFRPAAQHKAPVTIVDCHAVTGAVATVARDEREVTLWTMTDTSAPAKRLILRGGHPENSIEGIAFSENGSQLVSFDYASTFVTWDVKTGAIVKSIGTSDINEHKYLSTRCGRAFYGDFYTCMIARSINRDYIALAQNYEAQIIDAVSGDVEKQFSIGEPAYSVSISPDLSAVASCGYHGTLVVNLVKGGEVKVSSPLGECYALAFSSDGRLAVTGSGGSLVVLDLSDKLGLPDPKGIVGFTVQVHSAAISCMAWTKDNNLIITAAADGYVFVLDSRSLEVMATFKLAAAPMAMQLSEPYLALGDVDGRLYTLRLVRPSAA